MWTPFCSNLLTVALFVLVTKSDAETKLQASLRHATAKRWKLADNNLVKYYIVLPEERKQSEYRDKFSNTLLEALAVLSWQECVRMIHTRHLTSANLVIVGYSGSNKILVRGECEQGNAELGVAYLDAVNPNKNDYIRTILMCLAPFTFEHQRPDRDKYVKILWENIKDGYEHFFFRKCEPPPNHRAFQEFRVNSTLMVPWNWFSKNGLNTYEPRKRQYLQYVYYDYDLDFKRLAFYYSKLLYPMKINKTTFFGWTYETSSMEPSPRCTAWLRN